VIVTSYSSCDSSSFAGLAALLFAAGVDDEDDAMATVDALSMACMICGCV